MLQKSRVQEKKVKKKKHCQNQPTKVFDSASFSVEKWNKTYHISDFTLQ